MESTKTYRLDRYKTAFLDYEAATRQFHESVLVIALAEGSVGTSLKSATYELEFKHKYLIECARRLTGED